MNEQVECTTGHNTPAQEVEMHTLYTGGRWGTGGNNQEQEDNHAGDT